MERIIHFNNMIDTLSSPEYEAFIQQLTNDKDSFKSLLFNLCVCELFTEQNEINDSNLTVDGINDIISQIIHQRGKVNKQNCDKQTKFNIDNIPKDLIGKISSFLSLKESVSFSECNKFIFIASRSPSKINVINQREMAEYDAYFTTNSKLAKITMDKFKNATILSLNCTHHTAIHYLSLSPSIWKHLTRLNLYDCNVPDFFINQNHSNLQLSNIKTLILNGIHFEPEDESVMVEEGEEFNSLIKILSQFKNLEFLDLSRTNCISDISDISVERIIHIPSLSNLRGLALLWINTESICNVLLKTFSKRLESLHIGHNDGIFGYIRESFPNDVKTYKFENIKELCIDGDVEKEDAEILKNVNCNTLKRIFIATMNPHHYEIPVFLLYSSSLEYIELNESLKRSLDALIKALMIKRNSIKIKLLFDCTIKEWENGVNVQFISLLTILQQYTKDFMLILTKYDDSKFDGYFIEVKQKYLVNQYDDMLIISNFGCILNGYKEKWLMECEWCNH